VHQSLGSLGSETRSSQWRERPALQPHTAQRVIWTRRDQTNPIGLLTTRYPATCRLVGRESFSLAARRYVQSHPPERPINHRFVDDFPHFLRSLGDLACIEYVADVAQLEMLRHNAERVPRAQPAVTPIVSRLPGETREKLRVLLHASVYLVQSRFPIVTAWEINRTNSAGGVVERWVGEAAMVARPFLRVEVRRLPSGGYAFLTALSEGQTVGTAAGTASDVSPGFDVVAVLELIEDAKVIAGVRR
jgi:Putative DNA-binding domain